MKLAQKEPFKGLFQEVSNKEIDKKEIAARVIEKPQMLPEIFAGLNADKANIKYGCDKILRIISEKEPALLYPKIDFFISNLEHDNNFFKWGAIHIIANLAIVDSKNKIEKNFDKYFAPISGPVLVTAANVVQGAAKIALAKPALTNRVTQELLKVEKAKYQTEECRNIALGKTIESFDQFFDQIENKNLVIKLIKKQRENTRNATRKKAEKFLKKHHNGK